MLRGDRGGDWFASVLGQGRVATARRYHRLAISHRKKNTTQILVVLNSNQKPARPQMLVLLLKNKMDGVLGLRFESYEDQFYDS